MSASPYPAELLRLLERFGRGDLEIDDAARAVQQIHGISTVDGAAIDLDRQRRCGFGEVIFGEGKSTDLIIEIVRSQLEADQDALVTRIDPTAAAQVRRVFEQTAYHAAARTLRVSTRPCRDMRIDLALQTRDLPRHVAVVAAGSTDWPVAAEACETLSWMGVAHACYEDLGVAGPARLLQRVAEIREASAVVVVAGMEGALPAVVGGHVSVPVFAVPTSVGYGANLGGLTPLMGMLSCCAANVAVVNIDGGFKGGYLAGLTVAGIVKATGRSMTPSNPETQGVKDT